MDEPESTRGRTARKLGKIALVAAASAALLYLGAVVLLHALLDPDDLARWAEPRMESALAREVELGGVGLAVFPGLSVELRDLAVAGPEGMEDPHVASVERLRLGIALLPLLRRRVRVDEAVAEGVDLRLRVAEDGRSNFGDFVPEDTASAGGRDPSGSPLSLEIREVRLEGGRVAYRDASAGRSLEAEGVDGRATLARAEDGWEVEGRIGAESLRGEGLPGAPRWAGASAGLTLTGRSDAKLRSLQVEAGTARLGRIELSVAGRVDSLRSPVRRLDLRVRTDDLPVEDAAAFLRAEDGPPGGEAGGAIGLDLQIAGGLGPGRRPTVTGLATLEGGRYRDAEGRVMASELEAEARLATDSAVVRRLAGRILGGPVEARGVVRLREGRPFEASVRAAPRLERAPGAGDGGLEASGAARVDLDVSGRLGSPASTRARGTVAPEGVTVRRDRWAGPVALPGGTVRLEGDAASAAGLPVVVVGDTLRLSGRVSRVFSHLGTRDGRPDADLVVRGDRLDLGALFPGEGPDRPSYGQLAFAHLGGRPLDGRSAVEAAVARGLSRPGVPPVGGVVRLEIGEVAYGPWRLSDVAARLLLGADRIEVRDAALSALGGRMGGSMSLGVGRGAREPFSLSLRAEDVAGEELLSRITPVGSLLSGATSLELSVSGSLDTLLLPVTEGLAGEGRLEVAGGRVRENPVTAAVSQRLSLPMLRSPAFDRLVVPFRIRGDSLQLPSGSLAADSLSVRLDGVLGLGGRLDLTAALQLPRGALSGVSLPGGAAGEALGELLTRGEGAGALALGLTGTTSRPRVEVRVAPGAGGLPGVLRKEGEEQLEKRARGLLDRVLGGGRRPPADSAARDTARPDSAPPPPDASGQG